MTGAPVNAPCPQTVTAGNRRLGSGQPMFLVAEIGINHNGDMDLARRTIDAAAASGADGVKFQNFVTEDFILDRRLTYDYISQGREVTESQFDMFKRCELRPGQLGQLKEHCESAGLVCFSTPSSVAGVVELAQLKAPLLKNGSDYLTHLPVVRAMAATGIPTVLSTGMATLAEIAAAVDAFRQAGGSDLILLHCTSSYPTPPEDANLRKIPTLASAFGCPIGFSDHTEGVTAALGALALGACMLEKHFTLDRNLPGPDHRFSADPAEFAALTHAVRRLEEQLGQSAIGPTASEQLGRAAFRISCAAARDLAAGERLTARDILFLRPGSGIPPAQADLLSGRKLARPKAAGEVFTAGDLD